MRFRAAAAAVDRRPIASRRVRVRMCVCAYTGSFFLHIALPLPDTSGHVPPVTHPRPPRSPCHRATHFRHPWERPGPTYPRHFRDELFRLHVLSVSFRHLSSFPRRCNARVRRFNKNLLTFPRCASRVKMPTFHMSFALAYYIITDDIAQCSMISSNFTYTYNYINE